MEPTLTRQTPAQHIVWLDVVRLVAMFTVVCCHCTDPFNFYPGTSPDIVDIKFWGAVYGAALRPCVPLFVMITGALLLPVRGDASAFYKKRIPRVFFPFLIWSVIYNLFPWITGLLGVDPKVILDFFPYSGEEVMRQSLAVSLGYIAEMPFNFSLLGTHVVYLSADRALSLSSDILGMGGEGLGTCQTMVSCSMGSDTAAALLYRVCRSVPLGDLLVELVRYAVLLCRF